MPTMKLHLSRFSKSWLAKCFIVALSFCALGVWALGDGHAKPSVAFEAASYPQAITIEKKTLRLPLTLHGMVRPLRALDLSFEQEGTVALCNVAPGDEVSEGDQLVELDTHQGQLRIQEARARLTGMQAQLAHAQRAYRRASDLWETNAVSLAQLDDAEKQYRAAQSDTQAAEYSLAALKDRHKQSVLRAPADGVVVAVYAEPGEMARPGMPALRLHTAGSKMVEVPWPVSLGGLVSDGQKFEVQLSGASEPVTLSVHELSESTDERGRYRTLVRLRLPEQVPAYSGQPARVQAFRKPVEGFAVPTDALEQLGTEGPHVLIATDRGTKRVDVKVIAVQGATSLVDGALKEGMKVLPSSARLMSASPGKKRP